MTGEIEFVKRQILLSGTDDWVHIVEAIFYASEAVLGEHRLDEFPTDPTLTDVQLWPARERWQIAQERRFLPLVITVVKQLLREGLVEVGEVRDGFVPWQGSPREIEDRLDRVAEQAVFPLIPSDLFWINNTASGDATAVAIDPGDKSSPHPTSVSPDPADHRGRRPGSADCWPTRQGHDNKRRQH